MLKKLFRKMSGIKDYNELQDICYEILQMRDNSENTVIGELVRNKDTFNDLMDNIKPLLIYISEAANVKEQKLKLREKTIEMLELYISYKSLLSDDRDETEKRIIAKH